jgi:exosortase
MKTKMRFFILLGLLAGLGGLVYASTLSDLFFSVIQREDSSHGICVPFIAGYLIWLKLAKIKETKAEFAPALGMMLAAPGMLLFFLAGESQDVFLPSFSFLLVAGGLIIGLFGKDVFKELCFPFFFLAAMIPLPTPLYAQLTEWMRISTTWGSVSVLQLFHFPIYRDGYNISLPNMNLFVANSCSGIRYLIPYFVFGLAYAFVCKNTMRSRVLVVLATIPMSILGGVLRQSIIFLSAYYISPVMAEHRPHVMISWSVFVVVLTGAMGLDRKISKKLETRSRKA